MVQQNTSNQLNQHCQAEDWTLETTTAATEETNTQGHAYQSQQLK